MPTPTITHDYSEFEQAYEHWLADCLAEYNSRFDELRKYCCIPDDGDYNPAELVEFAEDGDAYPHGAGGTGHIKKAVTPWSESHHYVMFVLK